MMRHTVVLVDGGTMLVYFTRGGDAPERVMLSTAKLTGDWTTRKLSAPVDVLLPDIPGSASAGVAPVPEPETLALFVLAILCGVAARRWTKCESTPPSGLCGKPGPRAIQ